MLINKKILKKKKKKIEFECICEKASTANRPQAILTLQNDNSMLALKSYNSSQIRY